MNRNRIGERQQCEKWAEIFRLSFIVLSAAEKFSLGFVIVSSHCHIVLFFSSMRFPRHHTAWDIRCSPWIYDFSSLSLSSLLCRAHKHYCFHSLQLSPWLLLLLSCFAQANDAPELLLFKWSAVEQAKESPIQTKNEANEWYCYLFFCTLRHQIHDVWTLLSLPHSNNNNNNNNMNDNNNNNDSWINIEFRVIVDWTIIFGKISKHSVVMPAWTK